MGRGSSDSDSDKRGKRSRHRSSSSDSSDSRSRHRKDKKSSRSRHSRSRQSSSRSYQKSSKSHRSSSHHRRSNRSRRSRSKSYIREYVSKPRRRSSSSSSSVEIVRESKSNRKTADVVVRVKDSPSPDCVVVDSKVLEEINKDKFVPKEFKSSKKVLDNILIDLKKNTIKVPEVEPSEPDSIFYHNLFQSEELRMEKWVKELYSFRQKALQQTVKPSN